MQISTMTYRVKFYYLLKSKTNYNKKMEKHLYSEKKKKQEKGTEFQEKLSWSQIKYKCLFIYIYKARYSDNYSDFNS